MSLRSSPGGSFVSGFGCTRMAALAPCAGETAMAAFRAPPRGLLPWDEIARRTFASDGKNVTGLPWGEDS